MIYARNTFKGKCQIIDARIVFTGKKSINDECK